MPGVSPGVDPSMPSRSRGHAEASHNNFNVTLVPDEPNVALTTQTVGAFSIRDATLVEEPSNTSLQASRYSGFRRHRLPLDPYPSFSPDPNNLLELSPSRANLLAGADVPNTHHVTSLEGHSNPMANQSLLTLQPGEAAMHMHAESVQVAAFERDAASVAILHNQEEATLPLGEWERGLDLTGFNIAQVRHEVQSSQVARQGVVPRWNEPFVGPSQNSQNRPMMGNQHVAFREFGITERDSRMFPNEHQLAATQQRHHVALVSPDSINPSYQTLDNQNVFEDPDQVPSTFVQYPNLAINNMLSPTRLQYAPDSMQAVTFPIDVNATVRETPTVSGGPSILGNQQLADMKIGITVRDSRIALNEHQLAATQQRHRVALVPPDSINSSSQTLERQYVFEDLSAVPSTAIQYPNPASPLLSPNNPQISDTLQAVAVPTVVEATGLVTPKVSGRDFGITERDSRMFPNEHQLAATQQRHHVALVSPDSISGPPAQPGGSQSNFQNASGTLQVVAVPTVVEATGRVTPKVPGGGFPAQSGENHSQSSNVAAQNAVASLPQSLHHSGISPVPVVANPQPAELVPVSSLPITLSVMVPSALAASGFSTSESVLVQQLQAEVSRLSSALQLQQQQLQQMQQQLQSRANPQLQEVASVRPSLSANLPTVSNAVVPRAHAVSGSNPTLANAHQAIAPARAPPASIAEGAASGAPLGIGLSHARHAGTPCGNSTRRATGSELFPQQVLPPVVPPLPLHLVRRGAQHSMPSYFHHKSSCRSSDSSSSESSSDSSSLAPVDFARQEEKTIMVKSLTDLVFPYPPVNAGGVNGYRQTSKDPWQ